MQNLSVREFKSLCDSISPKQFIFSSENQDWNKVEHNIRVKTTYTIMMIGFNPNTICLKNSTDYLCLDRVKGIKLNDERSMLGMIFTVICGDSGNNLNDIGYTIIAR